MARCIGAVARIRITEVRSRPLLNFLFLLSRFFLIRFHALFFFRAWLGTIAILDVSIETKFILGKLLSSPVRCSWLDSNRNPTASYMPLMLLWIPTTRNSLLSACGLTPAAGVVLFFVFFRIRVSRDSGVGLQ